jgi:hypothetical protein
MGRDWARMADAVSASDGEIRGNAGRDAGRCRLRLCVRREWVIRPTCVDIVWIFLFPLLYLIGGRY